MSTKVQSFFFIIDGSLPSLNEYVNACRANRYAANTMKKNSDGRVILAISNAVKASFPNKLTIPVAMVDFNIHWFCKDKRKDKDNIIFAKKFIFDGCVKAGVLKTDSWAHIGDITETLSLDKQSPRIEVTMYFDKIAG